jgi:hypothetical protein
MPTSLLFDHAIILVNDLDAAIADRAWASMPLWQQARERRDHNALIVSPTGRMNCSHRGRSQPKRAPDYWRTFRGVEGLAGCAGLG